MCALLKLFKQNHKRLEDMSEVEINRYINALNRKIEKETVDSRISTHSETEKDQLYEKIKKRDDAVVFLERKREESNLH